MGKSSLVKAVHAEVDGEASGRAWPWSRSTARTFQSLPQLLSAAAATKRRFLLFCDDLSFDNDDTSYKSLKAVLDGGIEGRPDNVVFYATSNRRHLMSRDMIENERSHRHQSPTRRSRRRSRCPTASACGSASTTATSRPSSP